MEIIEMKVDELKPYENNPRINDNAVEPVARSIEEFGFKVPILIDDNNVVITGHTRLKAAKHLKLDRVPCIRCSDLTPQQAKAFRLVDNKVGEFADWDLRKLNIELSKIDLSGVNMEDFGFYELPEINIDDYLKDMPNKTPDGGEPQRIQCPFCHEWFDLP